VQAPSRQEAVVSAMQGALDHWLRYRDDVALACGIVRDGERG
jgi:hypothetical protein